MRFSLTPDAEADLLDIAEEIARDNPERSKAYIDELLERTAQAAERPKLFRLRSEWGQATRCARHGNYLILFEMEAEGVVILRYLHGSRNVARIMSGDGT